MLAGLKVKQLKVILLIAKNDKLSLHNNVTKCQITCPKKTDYTHDKFWTQHAEKYYTPLIYRRMYEKGFFYLNGSLLCRFYGFCQRQQ
jgi:hypothetical protein